LQTGEDFVRVDRHQAKNLRDTIDKFPRVRAPRASPQQPVEEAVEEEGAAVAVEMIEESREDFTRAERARPGRKSERKA
jgi:hypothetical protein